MNICVKNGKWIALLFFTYFRYYRYILGWNLFLWTKNIKKACKNLRSCYNKNAATKKLVIVNVFLYISNNVMREAPFAKKEIEIKVAS